MKIYIVIVSDHHSGDSLYPFLDESLALAKAKNATANMLRAYSADSERLDTELNDSMIRAGWLYYASLEDCGSVRAEERQLGDYK